MIDTSARLLRLLTMLQARRHWTGAELAQRLEVTSRTLRRDVERLRSLGYPVRSSTGVSGGYALGAGASLPPVSFEDDEVLAVVLGLRLAATGVASGMEESGLRALTKLEQVMPARLRKRMSGMHAAVTPLVRSGPAVDMKKLSTLAVACRDQVCIEFGYQGQDERRSERDVEPHALVCTGARWYLLGWDRDRGDWRTFRADRIASRITSGARFLPRRVPGGDPAAYVATSVSTAQYPLRARIVLHAPLERMAEYISPLAGRLEAIDSDRCVLETGARSPEVLAAHLAAYGVEFEVLDPPQLVEQVARMAQRLSRAAAATVREPD